MKKTMRSCGRESLQIVLEFSVIPIMELTMSKRRKYKITTCVSVNAIGGTISFFFDVHGASQWH